MQCVDHYMCMYTDLTTPQAAQQAALSLQQATYAAQLTALDRCLTSLRINLYEPAKYVLAKGYTHMDIHISSCCACEIVCEVAYCMIA